MATGASTAIDSRSLEALKAAANKDPKSAVHEAAKQFESLFMQEVMKSMRSSTLNSGLLENGGTQLGTEMLDSQFAQKMSGLPGGLTDAISRQLQRQMGIKTGSTPNPTSVDAAQMKAQSASLPSLSKSNVPSHVQQFIKRHDSDAKAAAAATGIPASFMLAQAAHESGWGQHEITGKDGTPSYNVFGIKADPSWKGRTTDVQTTEYVNGTAQKVTAKFRAYGSYAEAFKDYASMISSNQRYSHVVAQSTSAESFARGLQKAGYATDPDYATKLASVIHTTVRAQRAMA